MSIKLKNKNPFNHVTKLLVTILFLGGILQLAPNSAPAVYAQSAADIIELKVFGPAYATAGSNITYELTVKNKSTSTVNDLEIQNPLPANTTYVSGGTLYGSEVVFTPSLTAGQTKTVTFTVNVASSVAVGTAIENKNIVVLVGNSEFTEDGVVTTVEAPGTVEAVFKNSNGIAFDPALNTYNFANYGNDAPRNFNDDLGPDDLFALFGEDACQSGTTASDCVLSGPAQKWMENQIKGANGGHCEGMAVTSLRLFSGLDFKGLSTPGDFQSGASNTVDLNFPLDTLENYIMYYFVPQEVDEVKNATITESPNDIVDRLIADFNKSEPVAYTIGIYLLPDFKDGHAITAYGVEKVTNDEYRILVYDNNFPRQRQYITVNRAANTWRYATASTPGQPVSVYEGTATSENLEITPLNARNLSAGEYFTCPFCNNTGAQASAADIGVLAAPLPQDMKDGTIRFEYADEGAFLVVNDDDQATGFDFNTETFVNEIPNADVTYFKGGLGKEIPPTIDVPYVEADEALYSVFISGKTIDAATDGSLIMTGAGYAMGLDFIQLDPDELLELAISPDGDYLAFIASQTVDAPAMFVSYDPISEDDPSIIFEVDGVILDAGEQVSLELDPDLERIYFDDTGALGQEFDVTMTMIWPDGDVEEYVQSIDVPEGATSAFIDFGAWDGLGDPSIYIDDILQNPLANHRIKLESSTGTYDPTPQANAPAGVYHVEATFTNVTEVSLNDVYFTVADLGAGNVVLNADGGPAGVGAEILVPATALGANELLDANESFTFTFDVGLAIAGASDLTVDANGEPWDWTPDADPAPSYDANNESFVFTVSAGDLLATCGGYSVVQLFDGDIVAPGFTGNIVVGTNGADNLIGSNQADLIVGLKGADYINGKQGNDILCGNAGWDDIYGGKGHDVIDGGKGRDLLVGNNGNDTIDGGAGADYMEGNNGNDTMHGGIGADVLLGGSGHDDLFGDGGYDFIAGGKGNDNIEGGAGPDELFGNKGKDRLDGGNGNDSCDGGQGNDSIVNCEW